jgi:pyruvate dehydrogenase E1 component
LFSNMEHSCKLRLPNPAEALRRWIDACPNQLYSSLLFQGGAAWRKRLNDELGDQGPVSALIAQRSDDELAQLMTNLGGHDLPCTLQAFEHAPNDKPVVFICYTVKGFGLPLAGHKDNHSGLLTTSQLDVFRADNQIPPGQEWDRFAGLSLPAKELEDFIKNVPFNNDSRRKVESARLDIPHRLPLPKSESSMSTQQGFGLILSEIARSCEAYADRIVTTAPDVTVSTNLGGWVNRRKLFARDEMKDLFKAERIPSTYVWDFAPSGQHIELGIAEMNLFILLSALGLSHDLFGERLLPIGTLYDPFIARGLDALNYACYQDARFLLAATPSGITLAGEGGAHQSIGTPLIGMAQDGLAAFEPAFVDELAVMMRFAFDYMQRGGDAEPDARSWLRDATGGAVYLRLSTRPVEQPKREMTADLERDIVDGAYWLRKPGPNAELVLAYSGAVAPEAITAVGRLGEDRRDIGLLAVTSADRLNAGWTAAQRARERGLTHASSHIERLLTSLPRYCGIVTVLDGHPATLGWLGSVIGHRTRSLGVEHFGQTGSVAELYHHYGIDSDAIVAASEAIAPGRPIRHLKRV